MSTLSKKNSTGKPYLSCISILFYAFFGFYRACM